MFHDSHRGFILCEIMIIYSGFLDLYEYYVRKHLCTIAS